MSNEQMMRDLQQIGGAVTALTCAITAIAARSGNLEYVKETLEKSNDGKSSQNFLDGFESVLKALTLAAGQIPQQPSDQ